MNYEQIKKILLKHKPRLKKEYKIKELGVFGSYTKNAQTPHSDVDILVEFHEDAKLSLIDIARLEVELTHLLGIQVDLVEKRDLKPYIGKQVLAEVVYV